MCSQGGRRRARAWMPESEPCSQGCVARRRRAEGGSCPRSGQREPRRRARAWMPQGRQLPAQRAARARQRALSHGKPSVPCGHLVDNCGFRAPEAVRASVDRMALNVRNPHEAAGKEAIVKNRGKSARTYSLFYFLLQQKVCQSLHNPAVLTGTTTDLEFSRR